MQSRPTDPPLVTAANESWYVLREPVQFAGDLYYPAGPAVFFNGNTMVRSGHYNGVPLYMDATVEPFTVVLVPISRGLMQPYIRTQVTFPAVVMAAVSPTAPPLSPGAISVYTPETAGTVGISTPVAARETYVPLTDVVGTATSASTRPQAAEKWVSAGKAIPLTAAEFVQVGEYAGFPVFARRDFNQEVIYLPSLAGMIAPYRLKHP
jgi:hypothetical protein